MPHGLWDLSSPTRDWTCAPGSGNAKSKLLDHQGSPSPYSLTLLIAMFLLCFYRAAFFTLHGICLRSHFLKKLKHYLVKAETPTRVTAKAGFCLLNSGVWFPAWPDLSSVHWFSCPLLFSDLPGMCMFSCERPLQGLLPGAGRRFLGTTVSHCPFLINLNLVVCSLSLNL